MKKLLALILTLFLCVFIGACNNGNSNNTVSDYMESNTTVISSNYTISQENTSIGTEGNNSEDIDESTKTESNEKNSSHSSTSSKVEENKDNPSSNGNKVPSSQQKPPQSESTKTESSENSSSSKVEDNKPILTGIIVKYIGKRLKTGDTLKNSDFEVIAKYSDNRQIIVADFSINVTKLQKVGNNTVTVTYKNKSYSITLNVLEGNAPNANPGEEFGYEINNGELTITTYVGAKTDVVVPAWINDMPVTEIESLSEKVTSVILPDSITRIERKAFCGCNELVSITIGPNVVEMGDNIFYQCKKLRNVTIKTGATLIGRAMFSSCPSIESIVLPTTITTIEDSAFYYCEQ